MATEVLGDTNLENQDIIDLGFDAVTIRRLIQLRQKAASLVQNATKSKEGMENLGRVMGFLNSEIESTRI